MKIVSKSKVNRKQFKNLKVQDTFYQTPDMVGDLWMKTNSVSHVNAVCLSDGMCGVHEDDDYVYQVEVELHVL